MNSKTQTETPEFGAEEVRRLRGRLVQADETLQELRQREEAFRALAENSPDEISRFDRQFRYLYINRRPGRFMGKTLHESGFPDELVGLWKAHFQKVFDTGRPDIMEYEATAENGSRRFFQSRLVPEFAPEGDVASVLIVSRDITLRKQAEEAAEIAKAAAERVDLAKSEFLVRVRQEVHTLMKALLGFAQLMELENSTSEQRESFEQILKGARHMLDLINGMLDDSLVEDAPQ